MSSAAVQSGAGPLSLMSCVRESSPLHDYEPDNEKSNVGVRKKFWNPKSWFRKKNKQTHEDVTTIEITSKETIRSRSTSELSIPEEQTKRRSGSSMQPGLSVSHDSVFHSPNSGSDLESDAVQSSSSLSISQPQFDMRLQTELSERLRQRRGRGDTSEDDEGLPHSPCNSPTTTDGLLDKTAIKDLPTKSHSTCSDGSLLSMGSSEMDEESFSQQSRHSSKLSLHEKQDSDLELGPSSSIAPLNHSAAHHRVAVRPKRRAPHRNRVPQLSSALPTTPEVNEDASIRSVTPENLSKEAVTELYSMSTKTTTLTESQLKCSSLPPGLIAPGSENSKLNRSRSNAGSKSQDHFATLEEDVEKEEKLKSFFERILPRKSGKKRKSKEDKTKESKSTNNLVSSSTTTYSSYETSSSSFSKRLESKPVAAPRSGAASRQRVQPIDLPASPDADNSPSGFPEGGKAFGGTSPLQAELENRFRQRHSTSPPPPPVVQSPKIPKKFDNNTTPTVISKVEQVSISSSKQQQVEMRRESRSEEIRMKIPALSSLQQRVLSLDEADETPSNAAAGFKSLTDFIVDDHKPPRPNVTKSHSFKTKIDAQEKIEIITNNSGGGGPIVKVNSLSSVSAGGGEDGRRFHVDDDDEEIMKNIQPEQRPQHETKKDDGIVDDEEPVNFASLSFDSILNKSNNNNNNNGGITISGPSHTAIVNISNNSTESYQKTEKAANSFGDGVKEVTTKESVSVTKIQVKRESTQITQSTVTVPNKAVPEFFSRHLNKVETNKPMSNIVFSMNSPRIIDEQSRPKTLNIPPPTAGSVPEPKTRKFSQEDIEIIEKDQSSDLSPISNNNNNNNQLAPSRFRKNERKQSTATTPDSPKREKPFLSSRSISLDSLKGDLESSDRSSQDSLDKLDEKSSGGTPTKDRTSSSIVETVVLRRKSQIRQRNDEEPELMKVFARRSLKLKDTDSSDTSLNQTSTSLDGDEGLSSAASEQEGVKIEAAPSPPQEERKISKEFIKLKEPLVERQDNQVTDEPVSVPIEKAADVKSPIKEKLNKEPIETKLTETLSDVSPKMKRHNNNNFYGYQRAFSVNMAKTRETTTESGRKMNFSENRKTENWLSSNMKNGDDLLIERKISQEEIITGISPKSEFIDDKLNETNNFNQRKAEWEKRAQEAKKKSVP